MSEKHCLCTKSIKYFESIRTHFEKAVSDHAKAEAVMRYKLFKGQKFYTNVMLQGVDETHN